MGGSEKTQTKRKTVYGFMTPEELDKLAEEVYDWCNSRRKDNLNKDGSPGDPRRVSGPYAKTFEEVKTFYRLVVEWHLGKSNHENGLPVR